ncbi:Imm64 family immunity protein [Bacillus altitudinis]|uniref:Imm64 family immunity protein n=1 Tax=Bacillus altitudinis TaxID=293387 RepID=UPI00142D2ACD|nr:Imm64 family immunity protein [Bacillus altitudinis]
MVFYDDIHLITTFHKLTDYFTKKGILITEVKFSQDANGEAWIEHDVKENKIKNNYLEGFYTEFELEGTCLKHTTMNIQKEAGFVGFVLCLNWTEVVSHDVVRIQQEIVQCLVELYHTLPFEYAFSGHEMEVELHPDDVEKSLQEHHAFPVVLIGKGDYLVIFYGDTLIDGLTTQERGKKYLKVKREQ